VQPFRDSSHTGFKLRGIIVDDELLVSSRVMVDGFDFFVAADERARGHENMKEISRWARMTGQKIIHAQKYESPASGSSIDANPGVRDSGIMKLRKTPMAR